MPIIIRNMAKVTIPDAHKEAVFRLYTHESRGGDEVTNYLYQRGSDTVYLPLNREKLQHVATLLGGIEIIDERSPGDAIKESFRVSPSFQFRPHQEEPAPQLLAFVEKHRYAVLKANCSVGKTVVMTWVAGMLGKKTLVLVDQGNLAGQWQETFEKIVWNKKATILHKREDLEADVVIATFQMLHKNPELLASMRDMFGTCLIDEFHTAGAKTYRQVLFKLNSMYRIGTSATIMRKGFSEAILTDLVASVSVEMIDDKALVPEIRFINTEVPFFSNNPDDFTKTLTHLSENDVRNNLIVSLINKCVAKGRKVLLVGTRIEALKIMHSRISGFCSSVCYVGSTTLKQDKALRDGVADGSINVILTEKKAEKGLDLPSLDVVIVAKPMNNEATITQIVGRILRPHEGKPIPVVFDLVDRGTLSWRFAKNRYFWYKKLKYQMPETKPFFLGDPELFS